MNGLSADLYSVKAALERLPTVCRYHGDDFGKLGFEAPNFGAVHVDIDFEGVSIMLGMPVEFVDSDEILLVFKA